MGSQTDFLLPTPPQHEDRRGENEEAEAVKLDSADQLCGQRLFTVE